MSDNLPERRIETVTGEVMGGTVEIIRELSGFAGNACLIRQNGHYFIVSSAHAYSGFETLIFHANADGTVAEWCECGGGREIDRAQAIAEFERTGPYSWPDTDDDDEDDAPTELPAPFPWKLANDYREGDVF